ncbi:MAG TPA: fumarylacetoacetate hydrolase family protein [Candidatus Sulfotelmatobacter sp.]|nr:fumarylacetoacetate hydrolase family protein [Candidatus Sulfotelmatobacter sp.]
MKLATFLLDGAPAVGRIEPDGSGIVPLAALVGERAPADMLALIARYDAVRETLLAADGAPVELAGGALLAPIPRPARNIMCVGKNYYDHAREFGGSGFDSSVGTGGELVPDAPIIFTKVPESVIGDGIPIRYPAGVSDALDYEAELAVVIGRGGRGIGKADALHHVFGYTIVNDVTARDWQGRHKQWFLGKSFDTFCPMGPWIVTADEVDVASLEVRCWVNDQLRQRANTRDLIFDVPTLIETISAGITLYPGDVIATGTPAGVGIGFKPPKFLRPGDVVRIAIEGIGTLTNAVG